MSNTPASHVLRILLVDDDRGDFEVTRELLAQTLRGRPVVLDWLTSYDDALAAIGAGNHDVCLVEYSLGARDGLELLAEAAQRRASVPIIFLAREDDRGAEVRALAAGAADYLVKGAIDAATLERAIRHSLERSRSLEALRDRERQFRSVFEAALDAMLIADDEGRYVDGNEAALTLLGVSRARLLRMDLFSIVPADAREGVRASWHAFLHEGRLEGELRVRRPDGGERLVEHRATARITPGRHLSVLRDVTERRIAEEHRHRLAAIVESAVDAIYGVTLDGTVDYWSPAAERLYGYTAAEMLGRPKRLLVPDDRRNELDELLSRAQRGEAVRGAEQLRRRKDGSTFEASVSVSPVFQDGAIVALSVITRDISDKRKLEAQLALSDRMASVGTLAAGVAHEINNPLAAVLANLDFIAKELEDGDTLGENGSLHVVSLYETDEALHQTVAEYLAGGVAAGQPLVVIATPAHVAGFLAALAARGVDADALRARGELAVHDARATLERFMLDGRLDPAAFRKTIGEALGDRHRPRVYGEMVDLLFADGQTSAAALLEEAWNDLGAERPFTLLCAYDARHLRGASDVQLVCGAHGAVVPGEDRARPGTPWSLHHTRALTAEIASRKLLDGAGEPFSWLERLREPLGDARTAADRIRHVVRDLKLFSKPDEERRGPVNLRRVLESSLRMARNEIRHRAQLVRSYGEVPPVEGNEARLGQLFLNLIINAAQSIREGAADRQFIHVRTQLAEDGRVVVEVADTGEGIGPDALRRIFEPFYTSKPAGTGTGLGLTICRRIAQELGGTITAESAVGVGSTFRVTLPAADGEYAEPVRASLPSPSTRQRCRLLVIDDEPLIARAVQRALGPGHAVSSAASAAEALEQLQGGAEFDVILCDMMMPQMTGMDFYEVLAKTLPSQLERVVFLTGGAFTMASRAFLDQVPNPHVEKPFDTAQLRALVSERTARR